MSYERQEPLSRARCVWIHQAGSADPTVCVPLTAGWGRMLFVVPSGTQGPYRGVISAGSRSGAAGCREPQVLRSRIRVSKTPHERLQVKPPSAHKQTGLRGKDQLTPVVTFLVVWGRGFARVSCSEHWTPGFWLWSLPFPHRRSFPHAQAREGPQSGSSGVSPAPALGSGTQEGRDGQEALEVESDVTSSHHPGCHSPPSAPSSCPAEHTHCTVCTVEAGAPVL